MAVRAADKPNPPLDVTDGTGDCRGGLRRILPRPFKILLIEFRRHELVHELEQYADPPR